MSGVNKAIIVGNMGKDPETRYSKDGKPITNFSVATSQKSGDKEFTEWHSVVCFGRLAEITAEYCRKGSKVYVEGSLRTSSWEKDGQKHYRTEIIAGQVQMLDRKSDTAHPNESRPAAPQEDDGFDDKIPF